MQQCYRRGPALRRRRHWHAGLLPQRLPRALRRPGVVPAQARDAHRRHAPQGDRRAVDRAGALLPRLALEAQERADALRGAGRHVSPRLLRRLPAGDVAARPAAALPALRRPLPPARRGAPDLEREHRAAVRAPRRLAGNAGRRCRPGATARARCGSGALPGPRARRTRCGANTPTSSGSPSHGAKGPRRSGARAPRGRPRTSGSSWASCGRGSRSSSSQRAGRRRTGRSARCDEASTPSSAGGSPSGSCP